MHVHALTVDRGGCFHYRVRQPLTAMRTHGHWTSWGAAVDNETFSRADVLVAQYLHEPDTLGLWLEWCERGDKLCVWEADDDITTVLDNPAHGEAYQNPETLPRMIKMIEASHLVTVTTKDLARVYRRFNSNVVVLPNSVPAWMFDAPSTWKSDSKYTIGYTISKSHADDFTEFGHSYLRWMASEAGRTRLRLIGTPNRPAGAPKSWLIETHDWRKATPEYQALIPGFADVGIAPLLDTPFNRGKSGIKVLEYAAAGIPAIASDLQQYRDTMQNGVTGHLVRSRAQWVSALLHLSDPKRRKVLGENAREFAWERFRQEETVQLWIKAYGEGLERIGRHA